MPCKYFRADTQHCALSVSNHFVIWFQPTPSTPPPTPIDFASLIDAGASTRVHRVIGVFADGQIDVCPLKGESNGLTTCCPQYKETR